MATDIPETSLFRSGSVGVTYTRWGNNRCPHGEECVYTGTMAGSYYTHSGGGSNFLCLPEKPNYNELNTKSKGRISSLYGTEYENPIVGTDDHNAPCALCYVSGRSVQEMIPATTKCPEGWRREYYGYIMTAYYRYKRTEFMCIDKAQKSLPDSARNQEGALLYHVRATCTGIRCPPYDSKKVLTCVVCSR